MQNLYMAATFIREQQMLEMAVKINKGELSIEEAMLAYNVSTKEAIVERLENLKTMQKRGTATQIAASADMGFLAA